MKPTRYFAVACIAACLATAGVQAETTTLAKTGGWEAFGGTTNKGLGVCGVSTSPANRYFGLKQFADRDVFTIQISDKAWTIKDKTTYGVTMRFDNHPLWRATATGMHFGDGDPGLEYPIRREELGKFNKEFGSSQNLKIMFINGMPDWNINLSDVRKVSDEFVVCNKKLK